MNWPTWSGPFHIKDDILVNGCGSTRIDNQKDGSGPFAGKRVDNGFHRDGSG
jgi:hypothetical protein